jgi:uncharacterized membrane protein YpjA
MTYTLINPSNYNQPLSFNTIPQIIKYIKSLKLPSTTDFLIFPPHNPQTTIFFNLTLSQLIKIYKNNPNELL